MAKKEILTTTQKKVIDLVAADPGLQKMYLSGGTALAAFYLEHRLSDDLDFFSFEPIEPLLARTFMQKVKRELGAKDLRYERLYDRNLFFLQFGDGQELKMEFTHYPFKQIGKSDKHLGVRVDSLRDIAANKLMALLDRFDPKDFVDLFFLLKNSTLAQIQRDAEKKFGITISDMFVGRELTKVRRIKALPKMLKPLSVTELKKFFVGLARQVGSQLLE